MSQLDKHEVHEMKATQSKDPFEPSARLRVNKAYKMFVGGAFIRSESGRYVQVQAEDDLRERHSLTHSLDGHSTADPDLVNIPRGSRKDVRDAVRAANAAWNGWSARTAYNRGQILYRLAEVLESRRGELESSLVRAGATLQRAKSELDDSVDRTVFYAGFCDKIASLLASSNPVAGPHFGFSVPESMGVIGIVAPREPALLGLVSTILPVLAGGNTCVVAASEHDPRTAIQFCECVATSDVPGGVINVLTGNSKELAPALARHRDVAGIDAWVESSELRESIERDGADNVKRIKTHAPMNANEWSDDRRGQGISWIERFIETKTVWHPVGI